MPSPVRYALAVVLLTAVYALALASLSFWDLALGAVVSSVLLSVARLRLGGNPDSTSRAAYSGPSLASRLSATPAFFIAVLRDVVAGTWRVLLVVTDIRPARSPGIVGVPLGDRTDRGVTVSAFLAAFSPGTLLVRVDEDERIMWIHSVDAEDPEAVIAKEQRFYERYQRRVFP